MVNTILELSSVHSVITGCNLAPVGTGANLASVGTGCNLALAIFSIANFFFFLEILQGQNIGSSLYIVIFSKGWHKIYFVNQNMVKVKQSTIQLRFTLLSP